MTVTKPSAPSGTTFDARVPIDTIVRDDQNREIKRDEELDGLADSIRMNGVLQPLHVVALADGRLLLADGERRWCAAQQVGLAVVPCFVWPAGTNSRDVVTAGIALNEHRKAHGCLQVARRLRQLKNQSGESQEALAKRTGIPVLRVKFYLSLFDASDHLLEFFERDNVPLSVATEFVRYERATSEVAARRLVQRHAKAPLSVRDLVQLRKQKDSAEPKAKQQGRGVVEKLEHSFRQDPESTLAELRHLMARLG